MATCVTNRSGWYLDIIPISVLYLRIWIWGLNIFQFHEWEKLMILVHWFSCFSTYVAPTFHFLLALNVANHVFFWQCQSCRFLRRPQCVESRNAMVIKWLGLHSHGGLGDGQQFNNTDLCIYVYMFVYIYIYINYTHWCKNHHHGTDDNKPYTLVWP